MHSGMVDAQAAFDHHFFEIAKAEMLMSYARPAARSIAWVAA